MHDSAATPLGFPLMKESTAEDCLEALHALGAASGPVLLREVARWLGVRTELAATMIGQLCRDGVTASPRPPRVRLTPRGRQEAARVVRRRRLLESALVADHDYPVEAAQVIAARLAYAVPSEALDDAARRFGEPDLTPRAEPAPAWAVAMRRRLAHTARSVAQTC